MNEAADEPSKPTSAEPEFRKISDEELRRILENHRKWLAAKDKDPEDPLRADLSWADLRGQGAILKVAQLQWAELNGAQLQGADLSHAQLQGADLVEAQLQGAVLNYAQLREAVLNDAQLQGADLSHAQLQRAILNDAQLQRADLRGAELQGAHLLKAQLQKAVLVDAQLQGADLVEAQLQEADLSHAQLHEADLGGANFDPQELKKDGDPGQERPADLTAADFHDADLSNAQLKTVNGLRAEMLAGAVLTNAKLPGDVAKFDRLTHADETSRHAGTTFFALLAASLYSWLTIGTTTDAALITGAASSPLPIINTNIALSGFYWAAPLILLCVYFYLHLYLQRLWRDLSTLPAVFQDGGALDEKAYPWLLNGLVRAHFAHLKFTERPLSRLENLVSIALAWWVVPLTLGAFWLRYLPRQDWWGTGLHVALITIAVGFGVHCHRLAVRTLRGADASSALGQGEPALLAWVALGLQPRDFAEAILGQDEPLWAWIWRGIRSYRPDKWTVLAFSLALALSVGAAIVPLLEGNQLEGTASTTS